MHAHCGANWTHRIVSRRDLVRNDNLVPDSVVLGRHCGGMRASDAAMLGRGSVKCGCKSVGKCRRGLKAPQQTSARPHSPPGIFLLGASAQLPT